MGVGDIILLSLRDYQEGRADVILNLSLPFFNDLNRSRIFPT
jgi:hypothetical protein